MPEFLHEAVKVCPFVKDCVAGLVVGKQSFFSPLLKRAFRTETEI